MMLAELSANHLRATVLAMNARTLAIIGCLFATLVAAPAFAQDGDWQRVPSAPPATTPKVPPGAAGEPGGETNMGCALVARLAEAAATARDKGASEQSQLKIIDDPNGSLHTLAAASHLPFGATEVLSATIHREVVYIYAHPEMTPAQLEAHFEGECGQPSRSNE